MSADPVTKKTADELLDYGIPSDDDWSKDIDNSLQVRDDKTILSPRAQKRKAPGDKENDILGLDEEVKITKKRKPIAKLDEARLLSQLGLPKLRALARAGQISKKLHLKGKGHEFSDAGKLLGYYQLWLDSLYPRAKFADGLQLVEKAGHSKRMQVIRKEWIDEGKPGYARDKKVYDEDSYEARGFGDESDVDARPNGPANDNQQAESSDKRDKSTLANEADSEELFFPDANQPGDDDNDSMPDDDELEALLAEQASIPSFRPSLPAPDLRDGEDLDAYFGKQAMKFSYPISGGLKKMTTEDYPLNEEDDLDALLAAHHTQNEATDRPVERPGSLQDPDGYDARLLEKVAQLKARNRDAEQKEKDEAAELESRKRDEDQKEKSETEAQEPNYQARAA